MDNGKRILIFSTAYHPLVGGAEVAVKELTDRLADWEFDLVCARIRPGLPASERIGRVNVHRVGFGFAFDKYLLPVFGPFRARRIARGGSRMVWSIMASYGGFAALVYAWLRPRTFFFLTLQEGDPLEHYAQRAGLAGFLHRAVFRRADAIQAISRFLADWAVRMGARVTPEVIPNGVDLQRFKQAEPVAPHSGTVLITTSRLSRKNGVDDLIRALPLLPADVTLRIVGEGEDRGMLEALVRELGLRERVTFLGLQPMENIPRLLHDADIFVRPSLSEGLGNAFLEAMAVGLPIVGTPVGGIPDFLIDGETGIFCRPRDPASVAESVRRIVGESGLREKLIRNGVAIVREGYDWDAITKRMDRLFRSFAGMKVLLATGIYPPEIGGPAGYVHALAKALLDAGDEPTVMTYGDHQTRADEGWPVAVVRRAGGGLRRYARYAWQAYKLARRADVVYAQGPVCEGFPAAFAAFFARKPLVMKVVGDYAWEMYQQKTGNRGEPLDAFLRRRHSGAIGFLERIERWSAGRAKRLIAPSRYLARVVEAWGVPRDRVTVILNAVERVEPSAARDVLRGRFGLGDHTALLTAVRAVPWKGVDFLIELLPALPDSSILVVAGDGPSLAAWQELAIHLRVADRVRWLGRVNRRMLADWYAAADAFALASGYEGFPHVVAEAAEAGLPCAVSDQGGNPEARDCYPEHVTVLPYRDQQAWNEWLGKKRERLAPAQARPFSDVAGQTRDILKNVCAF